MAKFRKKPVEIEVFLWIGSPDQEEYPVWAIDAIKDGRMWFLPVPVAMQIKTLEGVMTANSGDWVIRGVEGEIYPCKASVFEKTYERVE